MRYLITFLFLFQFALAQEQPLLVDKVIGIVGDKVILLSDIELQHQQMEMENGSVPKNFRCQIIEQMLVQKMFLEHALVDSLSVSDDEIEGEMSRRIRYFINLIGSEEKLEEYYEKSIIEIKDEFRKDIEEQLLANKMQSEIFRGVKVTPSEIKSFFNEIPEDSLPFFNAEIEINELVIFPEVAPTQRQLALDKVEGIRERIINGEDFSTLAIIYSEDPGSASNGGDLGLIGRGELVTEFEAVAFRLQPNQVSEVVKTQFGYHIIQLLERKGEKIRVRHILIIPQVTSFDLVRAKEKLDTIREYIVSDSMSFEHATMEFSQEETSKNMGGAVLNPQTGTSYFEMNQLDRSLFLAIDGINVGEVSLPSLYQTPDGKQAYRLVYLKSETEAHVANLQNDYTKIKTATTTQKQQKAIDKWIREKTNETYTMLDPQYKSCINLDNWYQPKELIETYE